MQRHYQPGFNLEQVLDTVDDPAERACLIDEAYAMLGDLAIEPVVVDEEAIAIPDIIALRDL